MWLQWYRIYAQAKQSRSKVQQVQERDVEVRMCEGDKGSVRYERHYVRKEVKIIEVKVEFYIFCIMVRE